MKYLKKYSFLIGFLLLFLVLNKIDFSSLWQIIKKTDQKLLILAILLNPVFLFIKSICWNYLKKIQDIKYKLWDSFLMFNVGVAIGSLTPGRLGEVFKVAYLKKDGHSLGKSLMTIVLDRLSDFAALAFLGYFGLIIFFGSFYKITLYFGLAGFVLAGLILVTKKQIARQVLKKIFSLAVPKKYQEKWQTGFSDFLAGFKAYKLKNYLFVFLITFSSWIIFYVQMYLFAQSIGLKEISFLSLSVAVTVSGLVSILPVSLLGIGIRDITLLGLLSPLTQNTEAIILLSQLILLDYVILGLIGIISWIFRPIPLSLKTVPQSSASGD